MPKTHYCIQEHTEIGVDDKVWIDSKELLVYRVERGGSDLILFSDLMWREKKDILTKSSKIYPAKVNEVTTILKDIIGYIERAEWNQVEGLLEYEDRVAYIDFGNGNDIQDAIRDLKEAEQKHKEKVPDF